jgi:hypothetical protein
MTLVATKRGLDINDAIELVLDLAFQNVVDRLDNPGEYRRQMAAIRLVQDTFTKTGDRR